MSFPPPPIGGMPPMAQMSAPPMGGPSRGGPPLLVQQSPQAPPQPPGAPVLPPPQLGGAPMQRQAGSLLPSPGVPLAAVAPNEPTAPGQMPQPPVPGQPFPPLPPPPFAQAPGGQRYIPPLMGMPPPGMPPPGMPPPDGATIITAPPHMAVQDPFMNAPVTTVFVGNISDKVADNVVRQFLMHCGTVLNWKRVQGATGKLQAFGFCEYREPEATLRALRILNKLVIGDKALLVRVDTKTRKQLDDYMFESRGIKRPETDEDMKVEEHVDDEILEEDKRVKAMIASLIGDNVAPTTADELARSVEESMLHVAKQKGLVEKDGSFDDIRMDESEKRIVTDEIRKFRDAYDKDVPAEVTKRSTDREKDRDREKERKRSRSRSPSTSARDRDRDRKRGREELGYEEWEKLRKERKERRKEESLRKRTKDWEEREKRKARQYARDEEKDRERAELKAKEKKKMQRFLEKYDDDRSDKKYFSGKDWSHLKRDREDEIRDDQRDRKREEEEIEEEKRRIAEAERKAQEARVTLAQPIKVIAKPKEEKPKLLPPPIKAEASAPLLKEEGPKSPTSEQPAVLRGSPSRSLGAEYVAAQVKRQKEMEELAGKEAVTIVEAFNDSSLQEAEDEITMAMKKKLVPLEYTEEEQRAVGRTNIPMAEKKKRSIRALIDHIPTRKDDLFAYKVDWSTVDEILVDGKVKPWVNKKIVEYIGEEEPTLVSFICDKVLNHTPADSILRDVAMVLDEEAELFVTKLWRLIIFETESKLLGLVKKSKGSN